VAGLARRPSFRPAASRASQRPCSLRMLIAAGRVSRDARPQPGGQAPGALTEIASRLRLWTRLGPTGDPAPRLANGTRFVNSVRAPVADCGGGRCVGQPVRRPGDRRYFWSAEAAPAAAPLPCAARSRPLRRGQGLGCAAGCRRGRTCIVRQGPAPGAETRRGLVRRS